MSIKAVGWAFDQQLGDPMAKLTLIALADHYNESSGDCWPSIERLMQYTEASRSTVIRKLKLLEERGFISRKKRYNNTDLYRINFSGCHSETSQSDYFEVSERNTNRKEPLNNTIKRKDKKTKVSDWTPSDEDIAYAAELGLNAGEVLTDIRLWDEKNGNKAAYVSVSAFWQTWCRREAKRSPRALKRETGGDKAVRKVSPRQESMVDNLMAKYTKAYKHDDPKMIREALMTMMAQGLDIEGWYAMGHGLKHHTEF